MGLSIRAARVLREQQRQRQQERAEREAAARAALEEYTRNYVCRRAAAAHIGVSFHQLRRMMTAGVGPAYLKFGHDRQAVVRFPRVELDEYLADPDTYNATRVDRMAALARVAADV
jgi:hypothetical protein